MRNWYLLAALLFGMVGLAAVMGTDLMLFSVVPGDTRGVLQRLRFTSEPAVLVSAVFIPTVVALFAFHRWIHGGSRLFRGWMSVATAAWLSIAVNPIMWLVVLGSLFLYGALAFTAFLGAGAILHVLWFFFGKRILLNEDQK